MTRSPHGLWAAVVALGTAAACAPVTTPPETAPAPPRVATPAPAPAPSARERWAVPYRERAVALEAEGRLREALEAQRIALTIDPESTVGQEAVRRVAGEIERRIPLRIQEGRAALARGSHIEARRRFLAALALDPTNQAAFQALRSEVQDVETISHTVRSGESLATMAQRYYGDPARGEVIAETNRLTPNARVAVGTVLRIPEIPGLPFHRPDAPREVAAPRREATPSPGARVEPGREPPSPAEPARAEPARPETPPSPPVNPLLVEARAALERQDFATAAADADRLLAGQPGQADAVGIKKAALYGLGKAQLSQKRYQESYTTLTQLAKLAPDYEDAPTMLQQARTQLIEYHYGEGIRLYREEKLPEAIAQWRMVLELDPQHQSARRNLEQSERLLRGLEERRRR